MNQFSKIKSNKSSTVNPVIRFIVLLLVSLSLFSFPRNRLAAEINSGNSYYVSTTGSDANPGTLTHPWRTLGYAGTRISAGDTLYIRGGTYQEHFYIYNSGTQSYPILVTNYNNEGVIIDGINMTLPPHRSGTPLIGVLGDWVIVQNLTVANSGEYGVTVEGSHDILDNLYVHHSWATGVVLQGNYARAQNMRIWSNAMDNEGGILPYSWGSGISCARYPDYCTIRTTVAWGNWGEGISTYEALHTTIEDNIAYDNMGNFYISDTRYSVFQRNLSYYTPGTVMDFYTTNGIGVGDEKGVPIPLGPDGTRYPSSDNTFINNVTFGGNHGLMTGTSVNNNNLYANNTFGNSGGDTVEPVNILLNPGTCTNCRFINNVVVQDDDRRIISVEGTGWTFSNNLWSKAPPSAAASPGDVIGNPLFKEIGSPSSPEWFELTNLSPVIDRGVSLLKIVVDYFGYTRVMPPDIGAIEYISTP